MATEGFINPIVANQAIDSARASQARASEAAGMDAALQRVKHKDQLFEVKKVLHGQVALREALKAALHEVAPDHPLNNSNERQKIVDAAEQKTKPDDPWLP